MQRYSLLVFYSDCFAYYLSYYTLSEARSMARYLTKSYATSGRPRGALRIKLNIAPA